MRILLNRTDALGDTLLTLPVLYALREAFPKSRLGLIVSTHSAELLKAYNGPVDDVFTIGKSQPKKDFVKAIKSFRPDHYLYFGGPSWSNTLALLSGISHRGGLISKFTSYLFLNMGLRQKRSLEQVHETKANLLLLGPLFRMYGKDPDILNRDWPIDFSVGEKGVQRGRKILDELTKKPNSKVCVIHPGMTGHSLNWPPEMYAELALRIKAELRETSIVVSYTPSDRPYLDKFKASLKDKDSEVFYLDGQEIGLPSYLEVLSNASLFIGGSTGTGHMAGALGVPFLSFYSPVPAQSSTRWAPYLQNDDQKVLTPEVECPAFKSCLLERCKMHPCMRQITVDQAFMAIRKLLT